MSVTTHHYVGRKDQFDTLFGGFFDQCFGSFNEFLCGDGEWMGVTEGVSGCVSGWVRMYVLQGVCITDCICYRVYCVDV